ncbi:MAG TPA: NAD(P)H-dependent oxidoreductase [Methanocella sp.]|nr:NAD(P)H-dependent oxidoreductase [Methanocella sp.]
MKVLVAVYSKTFNTRKVATSIREAMGADLTLIEDAKPRGRALGAIQAMLRWKPAIKPCRTDLKDYDLLVLCCPTWSKSPPPAINSYIAGLQHTEGKKLAVAVTMGGSGGDRVVSRIRNTLENKGMWFMDNMILRTSDVQNGGYFRSADQFVSRVKSKAARPYVIEKTKKKVRRIASLLNTLMKIVR